MHCARRQREGENCTRRHEIVAFHPPPHHQSRLPRLPLSRVHLLFDGLHDEYLTVIDFARNIVTTVSRPSWLLCTVFADRNASGRSHQKGIKGKKRSIENGTDRRRRFDTFCLCRANGGQNRKTDLVSDTNSRSGETVYKWNF